MTFSYSVARTANPSVDKREIPLSLSASLLFLRSFNSVSPQISSLCPSFRFLFARLSFRRLIYATVYRGILSFSLEKRHALWNQATGRYLWNITLSLSLSLSLPTCPSWSLLYRLSLRSFFFASIRRELGFYSASEPAKKHGFDFRHVETLSRSVHSGKVYFPNVRWKPIFFNAAEFFVEDTPRSIYVPFFLTSYRSFMDTKYDPGIALDVVIRFSPKKLLESVSVG